MHRRRKVFLRGIVEAHFPLLNQLRQHCRCEHLGDRADLEDGIAIERRLAGSRIAVRDDALPSVRIDDSYNDACAPLVVDALLDDAEYLGVSWKRGLRPNSRDSGLLSGKGN